MKVMVIDTRVDLSHVAEGFLRKEPTADEQKAYSQEMEEWAKKPAATRGEKPVMDFKFMTATEFFKEVCGQALRQVHKSGNISSLRRTNKIMSEFDDAILHPEKEGKVKLESEDFLYVRNAFRKADQWQNTAEIAKSLILVDERFEQAVEQTV